MQWPVPQCLMDVAFGIFDHIDKQTFQPLSGTFADRLRVLELADKAGFYSYHVAEHHGTPLCMAAAPSLFLSALSQHTHTLRFGPLVFLLPLYHPLRLIEEVCMLDHLSGGRLDLGVGRGISPIELGYYGVDGKESAARFQEDLQILLLGLRSTRLTFEGQFHKLHDVPIELEPVQKPHPPIWYPTSALDRINWVAERGFNSVLLGGAERVKASLDRYWTVWEENHGVAESRPKVGAMRTILLADSDEEARRLAAPNFRQLYENLVKLWHEHGMHTASETFTPSIEEEIADGRSYVGSPATVRAQLSDFLERTDCQYVVVRPMFGDLPVERMLYSLQLFVHEVMPAFKAAKAAAPIA
jgi:alkanesulfonate monooxygenase SsuD/methylene tetrahydromethanopterin reductase-like flavin-dependent oxidoreductase (luciferase family)